MNNPKAYATEIILKGTKVTPSGVTMGYINGASAPYNELKVSHVNYDGREEALNTAVKSWSPWVEAMTKIGPVDTTKFKVYDWEIKEAERWAEHRNL